MNQISKDDCGEKEAIIQAALKSMSKEKGFKENE